MNFSIAPFTKDDFEQFQCYIHKAFHHKYILGNSQYLDWQFRCGGFYIVKNGNEIVGHFGWHDLAYKIYDRSQSVRVLINLFVLEPYRLTGVGALLAQKVFDTSDPVIVSGYTLPSERLFGRLRTQWQNAGKLYRWMYILNPHAVEFYRYQLPKVGVAKVSGRSMFIVKPVYKAGESLDRLWQEARRRYPVTLERTVDYLTWRFFDHPFFRYHFLVAKEGDVVWGYLVFRFEESSGFKIARIVDWVGNGLADESLVQEFLRISKDEGADAADFMFSGHFYDQVLAGVGFFNVADGDLENFPIYFNPISHKKSFINVGYDIEAPFDDCYITKANGDQDRPNPY